MACECGNCEELQKEIRAINEFLYTKYPQDLFAASCSQWYVDKTINEKRKREKEQLIKELKFLGYTVIPPDAKR